MIKVKDLFDIKIGDEIINSFNRHSGKVVSVDFNQKKFSIYSPLDGKTLNYLYSEASVNPELIIDYLTIIKRQNQLEFEF